MSFKVSLLQHVTSHYGKINDGWKARDKSMEKAKSRRLNYIQVV